MTTTKHAGECCKYCFNIETGVCVKPWCACHPKQSTELEVIIAEARLKFLEKDSPEFTSEALLAYLITVYHSGHTAGQAAERERVNNIFRDYKEKYPGAKWEDAIGLIFGSSLNKD